MLFWVMRGGDIMFKMIFGDTVKVTVDVKTEGISYKEIFESEKEE